MTSDAVQALLAQVHRGAQDGPAGHRGRRPRGVLRRGVRHVILA